MLQNKILQHHLSLLKTYVKRSAPDNNTLIRAEIYCPLSDEQIEYFTNQLEAAPTTAQRREWQLELGIREVVLEFAEPFDDCEMFQGLNDGYWETICNYLPDFHCNGKYITLTYIPRAKYLIEQFKDVKFEDIVNYYNESPGVPLTWDSYKAFK